MKSIIREIEHLFFPNFCPVCSSKLLPVEEGICLECIYQLPKTNNFRFPDNSMEELLAGRFVFERCASFCVFSKGGVLPPVIYQIKYKNGKNLGRTMGRLFGNDIKESSFLESVDLIVPVPLHRRKLRKRGYNQAEEISKGISESTNIPVSTENLIRVISNPTQTKRSKTQRWENVKDIFMLQSPDKYINKHILLVDDVITTGSTLEACALTLQEIHGIKISLATIGEAL